MGNIKEEKRRIRQEILWRRRELGADYRREAARAVVHRILNHERFQRAKVLFSFIPFGDEIDIRPVLETAWSQQKEVFVPKVDPASVQIHFYRITSWDDVEPGHYGILEPKGHMPRFDRGVVDLILMPGVAFDLKKNRIGYGKGYYDRFLKELDPVSYLLGVAFDLQVLEKIPSEPWDYPVDAIVTEKRWIG